jgi:hypothetical protein
MSFEKKMNHHLGRFERVPESGASHQSTAPTAANVGRYALLIKLQETTQSAVVAGWWHSGCGRSRVPPVPEAKAKGGPKGWWCGGFLVPKRVPGCWTSVQCEGDWRQY